MSGKLISTLLLATQFANAFNPATDQRACNVGSSCLTSFVWCGGDDCYYPENTYPTAEPNNLGNVAAVLFTPTYNLSWQNFDPNYPVQITLSFGLGTDRAGNWSVNVTNTEHYLFNFMDLATQFPTTTSNLTQDEVTGILATSFAQFQLWQPDAVATATVGNFPVRRASNAFIVHDSSIQYTLTTEAELARKAEYKKWEKGVGIAVGVGVPLLLAAAFLIGTLFGKRKSTRASAGDSKLSTTS